MKAWLDRNKIIFETLVAASLTVMGVLVSIAAVIVSVNANRLSEQSYALQRYGAEPVFEVKWEMDKGLYVIRNIGAKIHDVRYNIYSRLHVGFAEGELMIDFLDESYSRTDTLFNERRQSFSIATGSRIDSEGKELALDAVNGKNDFVIYGESYNIKVEYRNYLNQSCETEVTIWPYTNGKGFEYSIASSQPENSNFTVILDHNEKDPLEKIQNALSKYLAKHKSNTAS